MEPKLDIFKSFILAPHSNAGKKFSVKIKAEVEENLKSLLIEHCPDEVIMQKPILYGALPFSLHRDSSGIPINTHLLKFLKSGDTIVVDVEALIHGYVFRSDNIWDAIAFEEFAENAFERFKLVCHHVVQYH